MVHPKGEELSQDAKISETIHPQCFWIFFILASSRWNLLEVWNGVSCRSKVLSEPRLMERSNVSFLPLPWKGTVA